MGYWPDAEQSYNIAVQTDPSFADAYMKRARLYRILGRYQESMADYNRVISLNPYSEYIFNDRARLKMLATDYKGALDDLNKAQSIDPQEPELLEHRVDDLIALGDYEKALEDLDTLIARGYRLPSELEKKALVYLLMEDYGRSKVLLDSALALRPGSATAYDLLGLIDLKQGIYADAIAHFTSAISYDSSFAILWYNRALAYLMSYRPLMGCQDLQSSMDLEHGAARKAWTNFCGL